MQKVITRRSHGIITHVIYGWVAAAVPKEWKAQKAEMRGTSMLDKNGGKTAIYWDIAIDDRCVLHILKYTNSLDFEPYYFDESPL